MARVSLALAEKEIGRRDAVMRALIKRHGPCTLRKGRDDHFFALVESIAYQQLAGKAAAAIHKRLVERLSGNVSPASVLAVKDEVLLGAGLSKAKAASIKDLAAKVDSGLVPLDDVSSLSDDALVERLVTVRGIGRWTAEMFLMFQLRRLDVWPVDDYGVRKGYAVAYGLPDLPKPKELAALGDRFRPYRSIPAWYCWRAVDTTTQGRA